MAQDEQTDELFDFLYRDSSRLASLYAQVFGGHLSSVEQSDQSRKTDEKSGEGKIGVAGTGVSGSRKSSEETVELAKRTLHPHDMTVTDVLALLMEKGRIDRNIDSARSGSLVHAEGTLAFVDRSMLEFGVVAINSLIDDEKKKRGHEKNTEFIKNMENVKAFMTKMHLPSAFVLRLANTTLIAGTIKESGMEEPISTYYFKHGTAGLSGVQLVCIKEVPTANFELPQTNLIGMGNRAAKALHDMLFPATSIKVTPLVFFRKL